MAALPTDRGRAGEGGTVWSSVGAAVAMRVVAAECGDGTRLLVFGLGRDAGIWETLNRRGLTAFVEDVPQWVALSLTENPARLVFPVTYETRFRTSDYETAASIPLPALPVDLTSAGWDVVVVDAPQGFSDDSPGRASSIALAATLVRPGGVVLVDDYDRPLEARIARLVFGRAADAVIDPRRPVGLYRCM
ncbi:MAG: hypothetical protein JWP82_2296 [Humibacillus sp.]|nr:hypothetical protein [Humibacillus sp.]